LFWDGLPAARPKLEAMTRRLRTLRAFLDRPRLWRATAVLAALLLCGLVVAAGQGSVAVIGEHPATERASWERWCTTGQVREDRRRLAFCARIDGLVLASTHGPGRREIHVAVIGGFHLTIVRLPDGAAAPSPGTRLVAIGPMLRARNGQREVQAFKLVRG
jgi:hypothetical protein